ncbi:MAG: nicotinamide mononucleotide transporter [Clostridia bacterium]|nr:nicotinamide mononucleotide transporter [Clostridia bacterium]
MKKGYFTLFETCLFFGSVTLITVSFFLFGGQGYLSLAASLIGASAIIFSAKGNPMGPLLIIIFSTLYGIISYSYAYYGEMITYLGMSTPMSVWALIAWLRNPYKGKKIQVKVGSIKPREVAVILLVSVVVTVVFAFILYYLGTANILPSTISVTTSFLAAYLTYKRSPYFALVYALNDMVLLVLWTLATIEDISYLSMIICFIVFLANDTYSFINWKRMQKKQQS